MPAKEAMPFGCAVTVPNGELPLAPKQLRFNLGHGQVKTRVMGLGAAWGEDTCGDTPPWGLGSCSPRWGSPSRTGTGAAAGLQTCLWGGWDKAAASERGLNDSVFGGCCVI